MTNENENLDSLNEETREEDLVLLDADALRERLTKMSEANRQLFARAKKAEGFELKEGKWIKEAKPEKPVKLDETDYGQLAYLAAKNVEHEDDINYVLQIARETKESLNAVLAKTYVQAELRERAETRRVANALPPSSSRSSDQPRNSVDYWIAKGELPPREDVKLRREVVNARIAQEKQDKFTDTPVVK